MSRCAPASEAPTIARGSRQTSRAPSSSRRRRPAGGMKTCGARRRSRCRARIERRLASVAAISPTVRPRTASWPREHLGRRCTFCQSRDARAARALGVRALVELLAAARDREQRVLLRERQRGTARPSRGSASKMKPDARLMRRRIGRRTSAPSPPRRARARSRRPRAVSSVYSRLREVSASTFQLSGRFAASEMRP